GDDPGGGVQGMQQILGPGDRDMPLTEHRIRRRIGDHSAQFAVMVSGGAMVDLGDMRAIRRNDKHLRLSAPSQRRGGGNDHNLRIGATFQFHNAYRSTRTACGGVYPKSAFLTRMRTACGGVYPKSAFLTRMRTACGGVYPKSAFLT